MLGYLQMTQGAAEGGGQSCLTPHLGLRMQSTAFIEPNTMEERYTLKLMKRPEFSLCFTDNDFSLEL
jgi:hypothetical protein